MKLLFCIIFIIILINIGSCDEVLDIKKLLKTDNGGFGPTAKSQAFLLAIHNYNVFSNGTVKLENGTFLRIWPIIEVIK